MTLVLALLRLLDVQPVEIERLYTLPYEEASSLLATLKDRVRRNWRTVAFDLHPDRTNNDPQKTAQFRALLALKDKFQQMALPEPSPRQNVAPHTPGVVYGSVRARPPRPTARRPGYVAATMKP